MGNALKFALPIAGIAAPFMFPALGASMGLGTAGGLFGGPAAAGGMGLTGAASAAGGLGPAFGLGPAALAGGEALGAGMGLNSLFGAGAGSLGPGAVGSGLGGLFGPEGLAGAAGMSPTPFSMTPGGMAGGMNAMFPEQLPGLFGDGMGGLMDRLKDLDLSGLQDMMGQQDEQQQQPILPPPAPPLGAAGPAPSLAGTAQSEQMPAVPQGAAQTFAMGPYEEPAPPTALDGGQQEGILAALLASLAGNSGAAQARARLVRTTSTPSIGGR